MERVIDIERDVFNDELRYFHITLKKDTVVNYFYHNRTLEAF